LAPLSTEKTSGESPKSKAKNPIFSSGEVCALASLVVISKPPGIKSVISTAAPSPLLVIDVAAWVVSKRVYGVS